MGAGHSHHSHEHHHHRRGANARLRFALGITATFLVVEFIGGWFTNSLALLADSAHMLTDVAALSLSLFASWFSTRRATPQKTFGFYRVEILAAFVNGVLLVVIALGIFWEAYERLMAPPAVRAGWMLGIASIGLASNLLCAWLLFGHHRENLNVRGAFFHVASDAAGSIGAMIAAGVMLWGGYAIADPVISVIVAALILSSSWVLIRDAVDILLEGTPAHLNIVRLREQLQAVTGVGSVHDLHVWTLTSGVLAMSCHVVVFAGAERNDVLQRLSVIAKDQFSIDHTTIQIEDQLSNTNDLEECTCHFGAWDSR